MSDDGTADRSRYRVVDAWVEGILCGARLRPDGWDGPDLLLSAVNIGAGERFPVGSIEVVAPEQRERWRTAGLLLGP